MGQRDHRIDNIRFILILLVVFAHLIEPARNEYSIGAVYTVISAFHMPAFVFLTGYFARFSWRRIGLFALEYVVFQVIYLLVEWILGGGGDMGIQFLVPDWIMWYLLATVVWLLLVPVFKTSSRVRMAMTLGVSIVIAIAVGFADGIGYFLSLSRILVFAPFFIAGYYARRLAHPDVEEGSSKNVREAGRTLRLPPRAVLAAIGVVGVVATVAVALAGVVPPASLYNSMSYASTQTGPLMRFGMMALAACWICLLFAIVPNRRFRGVTNAGSHTMPVYLLHGLVVRVVRVTGLLGGLGGGALIAVSLVIAVALTFAFGNKICDKVVRFGLR